MITSVRLQNFRSYKDESFEFEKGVTIIVGPNASGKTNLLEAIAVLCDGRSFRVKDSELIMYKEPWARIDAQVGPDTRTIKLQETKSGAIEKTLMTNSETHKRITASKRMLAVLFEPNHLQLFQHGPEARREYLDDLAEKLNPSYAQTRSHYRRVLAQRNRLLKLRPADIRQQVFVWNIRLSELGGQIVKTRIALIEDINKQLPELYAQLASTKKKTIAHYQTRLPIDQYSSALLHKLDANLQDDIERGFTAYGPHRDDMQVQIDAHDMSESASRGETRTVLLSLKIIELRLVEAQNSTKPLLLLDDVFSELDGARRQALTEIISDHQTFITTTDADIVVQHFLDRCSIIPTRG